VSHVDRSLVRGSGRRLAFLGGVGIFVAVNGGAYGVWARWDGAGFLALFPMGDLGSADSSCISGQHMFRRT